MIVRLTISDTGTVGYQRLPASAATISGIDVVFAIRDARGNGPDHVGTLVGEIDGLGPAVELSLRNEEVPGWLDYTLRHSGEIIPSWKQDAFLRMDEAWQGRSPIVAPPTPQP